MSELSADHHAVAELLTQIEALAPGSARRAGAGATRTDTPEAAGTATGAGAGATGPPAAQTLPGLAERLSDLLLNHCADEEEYLFPAVHEQVPDGGALVLTSLADHLSIGQYVCDLQGLVPGDPAFAPLLTGLSDAVRTHLDEEERRLFPAVRTALDPALLATLGERLGEAREAREAGGGPAARAGGGGGDERDAQDGRTGPDTAPKPPGDPAPAAGTPPAGAPDRATPEG